MFFTWWKPGEAEVDPHQTLNAEHQLNFCAEEVEAKGAPEKLKIPQLNLGYEGNQQTRRQRHMGCDLYIQNTFVGR